MDKQDAEQLFDSIPMPRIYLDNNATTRPFPEVVEAMARCFRDSYGNPGSRHAEGRVARQALEKSRESIAGILGALPQEILFTSGGTEATNLALFGLTRSGPVCSSDGPEGVAGVIVLTAGEHPATAESCRHLAGQGWRLHALTVDPDGRLDSDQYDNLPWDQLKLVTVILAHNETGVIQDVRPLAERCQTHGVPLHLDAVQAVGKIPVDFHGLNASALSLGAHKFHGPRGIGVLLLRSGIELGPFLFGGHQESGRRPGTEPVALIVGMARALEIWSEQHEKRTTAVTALRDSLEQGLRETCAPVVVNGSREHRLPNTLNISFPGLEGEALLIALDLDGIDCSLGSTCASGSADPAPVLVAMGCRPDVYSSAVRFSVGIENTAGEIDEAVRRIAAIVDRQRRDANADAAVHSADKCLP